MKYFILLHIFPPEILNIIYKFIFIQESAEKILYNMASYHLKQAILYKSINNIIKTDPLNNNYELISDSNIYYLDFILKNYYSKNILTQYFWHNYLTVLSYKIMTINNNIIININSKQNINQKYNIYNKSLNKISKLWLQLCKKFNVTLKFGIKTKAYNISNNDFYIIDINAKCVKKILNFYNYVFSPKVLDNYNNEINIFDASIELTIIKDNYYDKM